MGWFSARSKTNCPTTVGPGSDPVSVDDLYEAVSQKMQSQWMALSGSCFDSDERLKNKQARLDELKVWARTIEDAATRKAYDRYFGVVQYTITRELEKIAQKSRARALAPNIPSPPMNR